MYILLPEKIHILNRNNSRRYQISQYSTDFTRVLIRQILFTIQTRRRMCVFVVCVCVGGGGGVVHSIASPRSIVDTETDKSDMQILRPNSV